VRWHWRRLRPGAQPQDNCNEVDRIVDASWLAALVRDVSKVLEDLGMYPIPGIPLGHAHSRRHPGGSGRHPRAREGGL
jgi:hypothetical protein